MKFNLHTPCKLCPFRTNIEPFLSQTRAESLVVDLTIAGKTFPCHKTVNYTDKRVPEDEEHCAGALIMLENDGSLSENQSLRIAMRLRIFDPDILDSKALVYKSCSAFIDAHKDK